MIALAAALWILAPQAAEAFSVKGTVVDARGAAVAGARVELERPAGELAAAGVKGMTDARGEFGLAAGDPRGKWRLRVQAGEAFAVVHDLPGEWKEIEIGNVAVYPPVEVEGVVVNEAGEPVHGAEVRCGVELEPEAQPLTFRSGDGGRFRAAVPRGRLWFGAEKAGFADAVRRGVVVGDGMDDVILTLGREGVVKGRIVDDAGAPVAGAEVLVRQKGARAAPWRKAVPSGADGAFQVVGLDAGARDLELRAAKFGHVPLAADGKLDFGQPLVLPRGLVVELRVNPPSPVARLELETMTKVGEGFKRDAVSFDGSVLGTAPLTAMPLTAPRGDYVRAHATLQGGGLASSAHVEVAKQKAPPVVEVDASKAAVPMTETAPRRPIGGPAESAPASRPNVRVDGTLTYGVSRVEEPTPVAVYRSLYDPDTKTRRTVFVTSSLASVGGSFAFPALQPGRYATIPKRPAPAWSGSHRSFSGELPPFAETGWQRSIDVPEGLTEMAYALSVPRPQDRWVAGVVRLDGAPAGGWTVELTPIEGVDGAGSAQTDAEGRYRIPNVKSGDYEVAVRGRGLRDARRVKLTDGQSRQMNFELDRGEVRGKCVDGEGMAVACGVLLQRQQTVENAEWWHWLSPRAETAADGSFAFTVLTPGKYRIVAYDAAHRRAVVASEPFEIAARQTLTVPSLVVPESRPLRVTAVDKQGGPGTGRVWVMAVDGERPLAHLAQSWLFAQHKAVVLHGLPPGRYRVKMPAYEEQTVELRPGSGVTNVHFKDLTPEGRTEPASRSAYQSAESKSQKQWDWGGETPELFETVVEP